MTSLLLCLLVSTTFVHSTKSNTEITQSSDCLAPDNFSQIEQPSSKAQLPENAVNKTSWLRTIKKLFCCCKQNNEASQIFDALTLEDPTLATSITRRYRTEINLIEKSYQSTYHKAHVLFTEKSIFSSEEILYIFEKTRLIQSEIETLFKLFEKYNGQLPNSFGTHTEARQNLIEMHRSLTQIYGGLTALFPHITHNSTLQLKPPKEDFGYCLPPE